MKKQIFWVLILGFFLLPNFGQASQPGSDGKNPLGWCAQLVSKLPRQPLSAEEKAGLLKMREEEKLARDVYFTLYQRWSLPVFANIGRSEQRHMDMVKLLLDKYGLEDPVKNLSMGYFSDSHMSELYEKLVRKGMASFGEAVKVGATIEDLDIYDLEQELKKTDNQDIKMVYQNLLKGSRNHMRIFVKWLQKMGETYKPQYISEKEFQKIISTPLERGPVDAQGKPLSLRQR